MTVVGLVPDGYVIEDIRTTIPYRIAVQIPANLVTRSRHLTDALQQQRVMQLGTPTVAAPPLAPILRGRGIAPHHTRPVAPPPAPAPWPPQEVLERELEASRAQCAYLQGINETLQVTLTNMTAQLAQIQMTLESFGSRQVFPTAATLSGRAQTSAEPSFLDEAIPHFIPETSSAAAEVRISLPETATETNVDEALAALRALRGKPRA